MPDSEGGQTSVLPVASPTGTQLEEFLIQGVLGTSDFSIVYLAHDVSLERRVVIEEYMPSALAKRATATTVAVHSDQYAEAFAAGLRSFVNESRLLAHFDHPSLLRVYRFWEAHGTAYRVMPYYHGITLGERLAKSDGPPYEAALKGLLRPLLDVLEMMHGQHCFHCNISPDSILILPDGRPLLMAPGAARRVIADMTPSLTVILNTGYLAIEQYGNAPELRQGAWTDLYALGSVLQFAITGHAPPPALSRLMDDRRDLLAVVGSRRYSTSFLSAVDQTLGVLPKNRPQSVSELRSLIGDGLPVDAEATVGIRVPSAARTEAPPYSPSPRAASSAPPTAQPASRSSGGLGNVIGTLAGVAAAPLIAVAAVPVLLVKGTVAAYRWLSAHRHTPAPTTLSPVRETPEPLRFGVSAPRHCYRDSEFVLAFMAYVGAERAAVLKQVQALVGQKHRQVLDVMPDGGAIWRTGTPFTVRVSGAAFSLDQPEQTFTWNGTKNLLGFVLRVRPEAPALAVLSVVVLVEDVVLAFFPIEIEIKEANRAGPKSAETRADTRPAPQSIFASYASNDAVDVSGRLSTLLRWAPRLDIFQDCLDLRPNESFKPQLAAQIVARDVFLLFWSRSAARSTWVRWEFETALAHKPPDAILPMPLEDPAIAPPPPELGEAHFRDRFLLAGYAFRGISDTARSLPPA